MNLIQKYQESFKKHLQKYILSLNHRHPKELYQLNQYILQSDAKHIRPILSLLACHLYGEKHSKALSVALAVELFHTFSLIHDDILDNATLRRGKKTIHTKWNTNIAILAGDVLLVEAFKQLNTYPSHIHHSLHKVFTLASVEICEGQQGDMNFEKQSIVSSYDYLEMIRKKTAVLIGTSLKMGSIVAQADSKEQNKIYKVGENICIAFQIMDDYLDIFGDPKIFGKKIGNDILSNKKTYLITKAYELANTSQKKQLKYLLHLPANEDKIHQMKQFLAELGIDILALKTAQDIHHKNLKLIHSLKAKYLPPKETLAQLSEQLINRTK